MGLVSCPVFRQAMTDPPSSDRKTPPEKALLRQRGPSCDGALSAAAGLPDVVVAGTVGYNLRLILEWLRKLPRQIVPAISVAMTPFSSLKPAP